jgi:anti-anti-sigma regulatory factor
MDIRIDIETRGPVEAVRISGRLVVSSIQQLTDVCEPMEGNFVLDLSELIFADDAGIDVIRSLREKGAAICGASAFIKLLIDG